MARRSDSRAMIAEVAEELPPGGLRGPTHRNLDDRRRKEDQARRTEAVSLKLAGLTYAQIGDRLEMSAEGARSLVSRSLERAENNAAAEMRELENARIDRAQAAIWSKVLEGDLRAVDTFLRLSSRRAKMNGLDAPTQINLSVDVRQEMEQALRTLEDVVLGEVTHVADADESG